MDEAKEPDENTESVRRLQPDSSTKSKLRLSVKPADIIIIAVFVVVVVVLVVTLINKITITHDVTNARAVSIKVISDIQARNGEGVYELGSPDFQKSYSATQLTSYFKGITIATLKPPALVNTVESGSSSSRAVYFIYKYTALKVPYYIRTEVHKSSGKWELLSISGNADETQLEQ